MRFITLPGIGGSGPDHWQTLWEASDSRFRRFDPSSWDQPDLLDWVAALERAVASSPAPPILVAHSLACLLVAHWAAVSRTPVAGALLVAVPDPAGPAFPVEAAGFAATLDRPLPFASLMVVSADDPYGSTDYAASVAKSWRSSLTTLGALGHINGASGLGDWPQGRVLLDTFCGTL